MEKKLKIVEEKENSLFNRRELLLNLDSEVSPKREEVFDLIASEFSVPKENVVIKKITGNFGSNSFDIHVMIYSSEEDKNKTEPKLKEKKK